MNYRPCASSSFEAANPYKITAISAFIYYYQVGVKIPRDNAVPGLEHGSLPAVDLYISKLSMYFRSTKNGPHIGLMDMTVRSERVSFQVNALCIKVTGKTDQLDL